MDKFKITPEQHKIIGVMIFLALIFFIKIQYGELQPWDEGVYATRAKTILIYGNFWDQTQHSIGGLYSSSYPPLTIWVMSWGLKFFDNELFAVRFLSFVCSVSAMIFLYLIGRRFVSYTNSLAVAFAVVGTLVWNTYSRQGMMDLPLASFLVINLWTVLKTTESRTNPQKWLFAGLFALTFAMALLTKIVISFLPLVFLFFVLKDKDKKPFFSTLIVAAIVGLALALPWYISMTIAHGWEFAKCLFVPHLYSAVENNTSNLGVFYYINQLLISNPIYLFSFVVGVLAIIKRKANAIRQEDRFLYNILLFWFWSAFLIFSISVTKLPHYTLYIVPPAILLAIKFIDDFVQFSPSMKKNWLLFTLLMILSIWALSFDVRQEFKELFSGKVGMDLMLFFFAAIVLLGLAFIYPQRKLNRLCVFAYSKGIAIILIVFVARTAITNFMEYPGTSFGAYDTADYIMERDPEMFLYVYVQHNPADTLNPQLNWYMHGRMAGWKKDRWYKPLPMPEQTFDQHKIRKIDDYPDELIVFYAPNKTALTNKIMEDIKEVRPILRQFKNYTVFGRQNAMRKIEFLARR